MRFTPAFSRNARPLPATACARLPAAAPAGNRLCFSHGRTALRVGLAQLGLAPGDRILVPDLVCDVVILPLRALGLEPVYFPVNEDLRADWAWLARAPLERVRAMVMIHYFGIPLDVPQFVEFCRERDLFLIEDNAHGHGGHHAGRQLGEIGDIGISSPWKNFPIRNGSFLYLAETVAPPVAFPQQRRSILPATRGVLRSFRRGWIYDNRRYAHGLQELPETAPIPAWDIAPEALEFLRHQDLGHCAARRREIYATWHGWAGRVGLRPACGEPGDAAPLVYPALCDSEAERHDLLEWCWQRGIDAYTWPKLPPAVLNSTSAAKDIWARLICLPIHQYMSAQALAGQLEDGIEG